MRKIDFLLIADDPELILRCEDLSVEFGYAFRVVPNVDIFAEQEDELKHATLILISAEKISGDSEIAGMVQVIKHIAPESFVVISIDARLDSSVAVFIKKSGANLVLMNTDIRETNKLEYAASQKISSSYVPIKVSEILPNTIIACTIYHSLPLNKKFLPVIMPGTLISEERVAKLAEVKIVYIRRVDVDKFRAYSEQMVSQGNPNASGLVRSRFLALANTYADLILLVIDQSEKISYSKGMELFGQCEKLAKELLDTVMTVDNAWEIVQESATGARGGVERVSAIAAYSGLLSLTSKLGEPLKTMTAVLLADIGLLEQTPFLARNLRQGVAVETWRQQDQKFYWHHPVTSLNLVLSRKFQVPEDVKEIILCSHETLDRSGYPNRPRSEKIPIESLIIQAAEKLDALSFTPVGKKLLNIVEVKKSVYENHIKNLSHLNFLYSERMKVALA
jgi:hypothetical protein